MQHSKYVFVTSEGEPSEVTLSSSKTALEGIQALHLDCSTMRSNLASEWTQMGQMAGKSSGSMMRTTSST